MKTFYITCATTRHPHNHVSHITHVGNCSAQWKMTVNEVIQLIKAGHIFLVPDQDGPKQLKPMTEVLVVESPSIAEHSYIKTKINKSHTDNLLSLDDCEC